MNLKDYLISKRNELNLTQKELAEKTGVLISTIQNIEHGKRNGSIDTWSKIDTAVNGALDYYKDIMNLSFTDELVIDKEFLPIIKQLFDEIIDSQKDLINSDEYEIGVDDLMLTILKILKEEVLTSQSLQMKIFKEYSQHREILVRNLGDNN